MVNKTSLIAKEVLSLLEKLKMPESSRPFSEFEQIYRKVRPLGTGTYGEVLLVREITTGKLFAAKKPTKEGVTQAQEELKHVRLLAHKNIVRFVESFTDGRKQPVITLVFEFCECKCITPLNYCVLVGTLGD